MSENDDLDLELDLTDTSADDLEGGNNVPPGKYHARIEEVKRVSDMTSYLRVKFALLAGTNPAGVGRALSERFYLTEKARKRINAFASRMRLVDAASLGSRVPRTNRPSCPRTRNQNPREAIGKTSNRPGDGTAGTRLRCRFYSPRGGTQCSAARHLMARRHRPTRRKPK